MFFLIVNITSHNISTKGSKLPLVFRNSNNFHSWCIQQIHSKLLVCEDIHIKTSSITLDQWANINLLILYQLSSKIFLPMRINCFNPKHHWPLYLLMILSNIYYKKKLLQLKFFSYLQRFCYNIPCSTQ